jgi:hypothetical protein
LFAALKLIESGIRPVILERERMFGKGEDLASLNKEGLINPERIIVLEKGAPAPIVTKIIYPQY